MARDYYEEFVLRAGGTPDEVADALREHVRTNMFYPAMAELVPLVQRRVGERLQIEALAARQRDAGLHGLDALGEDRGDWVRGEDLPFGYDFAADREWRHGMAILEKRSKGANLGIYNEIADLLNDPQPASMVDLRRRRACPGCLGARWVRTGHGYDGLKTQIGDDGRNYVRCPSCCPDGRYDPQAEQDARRRHVTGRPGRSGPTFTS